MSSADQRGPAWPNFFAGGERKIAKARHIEKPSIWKAIDKRRDALAIERLAPTFKLSQFGSSKCAAAAARQRQVEARGPDAGGGKAGEGAIAVVKVKRHPPDAAAQRIAPCGERNERGAGHDL